MHHLFYITDVLITDGMVGEINIVDFPVSKERGTVSGTTGSLQVNEIGNITIGGHKSYLLMNVQLSAAGWFRLYTDSASRTADANRSVGEKIPLLVVELSQK